MRDGAPESIICELGDRAKHLILSPLKPNRSVHTIDADFTDERGELLAGEEKRVEATEHMGCGSHCREFAVAVAGEGEDGFLDYSKTEFQREVVPSSHFYNVRESVD